MITGRHTITYSHKNLWL